jgi:tRNA(Ile)-lysidine synthase TilS/MesJ
VVDVTLCRTCVLNIASPQVPSRDGTCQYCRMFQEHETTMLARVQRLEGRFAGELEGRRGSGDYDCVVMVSGGKDSVMTLLKVARETSARPLALTIDNGFEPQAAIENARRAASRLGVDWILERPASFSRVLRAALKSQVPTSICRFCSYMIVNRGIRMARNVGAATIVTGWNKGQSDREPSRWPLWRLPEAALAGVLDEVGASTGLGLNDGENEDLLAGAGLAVMSPWIHENRKPDHIRTQLIHELDWVPTPSSYPRGSTSCNLNLLQVILSRKHFGYTHYDCEESSLINFGEKSRAEAIEVLSMPVDVGVVRQVLDSLAMSLHDVGLNEAELQDLSRFLAAPEPDFLAAPEPEENA